MIKPCTGVIPKDVEELVEEMGMGGIDIVKDDELSGDPVFCRVRDRIGGAMKSVKKVYEATGKKMLYAINITDRPDRMQEKAKQCIEAGANMLMVNAQATGAHCLQALAEDPDINVPASFFSSRFCRNNVRVSLIRACRAIYPWQAAAPWRADLVVYPCSYGKVSILKERYIRISQALTAPFHGIKPVFPSPGPPAFIRD